MVKNKNYRQDFPGDTVDKNPPAKAGDVGSPWSRRIPHAMEQLSLCATTTESMSHNCRSLHILEPVVWKPLQCESWHPARKSSARSPQLEKTHTQRYTPTHSYTGLHKAIQIQSDTGPHTAIQARAQRYGSTQSDNRPSTAKNRK